MEKPKVVIADLADSLLQEIITEFVRSEAKMDVCEQTFTRDEIGSLAESGSFDVLLVGLDEDETPRSIDRYLRSPRKPIVIGIIGDRSEGGVQSRIVQHSIYADDMGPTDLVNVILAASQRSIHGYLTDDTPNDRQLN